MIEVECRDCGYWSTFPEGTEMRHPDDDPLPCEYCGPGGILENEAAE